MRLDSISLPRVVVLSRQAYHVVEVVSDEPKMPDNYQAFFSGLNHTFV